MFTMFRVPRVMAAVLISLTLAVTALISSAGVASAQQQYNLVIQAPESAVVGQAFTVQVLFFAGETQVTDPCESPVTVELSITGPGPEQEPQADEVEGIATFSLTLDIAGTWWLSAADVEETCASFISAGPVALTVDPSGIPPWQPIAPCPPSDVTCEQTWNGQNTAATLIARSGDFTASFVDNGQLSCGGGHLEPNSVLKFDYYGNVRKRIIFALDRSIITKPLWRHQVCWSGDTEFVPRGGGAKVDTGLLRHCRWGVPAPCILFKRWVQGGATIGVLAPPGDPRGYVR